MSQVSNLFSVKMKIFFEGTKEPFVVNEYFSDENKEIRFATIGRNFAKWYGGLTIQPLKEMDLYSYKMRTGAKESDILESFNKKDYDISPVIVYHLLKKQEKRGIRVLTTDGITIFKSFSVLDDKYHLLGLFKKGGLWYIRGYESEVRERRNWFNGTHFLTTDSSLLL